MTYKIREHLDHVNQLEVATYRKNQDENEPIDSVTVECTVCGEVVEEIYNADYAEEVMQTTEKPPFDADFLTYTLEAAQLRCDVGLPDDVDALSEILQDSNKEFQLKLVLSCNEEQVRAIMTIVHAVEAEVK